ncbi:tetratricopeptide repeat protein [Streptomyces kebangsaanensis]|uniref:Tetratricopeptide repeat protein n=1 Tax=Streptomyces kebangsaanensis TaxID=864058 RepID=A0ABW6KPK9_9ACTN
MTGFGALCASARELLARAAWLAAEHVPEDLALSLLPDAPDGATDELVRACLVSPHPDGGFVMEARIGESVRSVVGERGRDEAILAMGRYLGDEGSPGEVARCLSLLPHLLHWVGLTRPEDDFVDGAMLMTRVVVLLLHQEIGAPALPLAERVVRTCEMHIGPEDLRTWRTRGVLASVLDKSGHVRRAARQAEKVIAGVSALYGEDHPQVWSTRQNLGSMYMRLREFDRAVSVVRRLIEHHTAVSGPGDRKTLMARHNLAVVLQRAGRLAEAVETWEACVPEFDAFLGVTDPDTMDVRRSLAAALEERAGLDPSGMSLEETEQTIEQVFGESGRVTQRYLEVLVHRATLLRDQGRLDEAESDFNKAIDLGSREVGPGHPIVVSAHYRLSLVHHLRGQDDLALAVAGRGLRESERSLGRTHHETLFTVACVLSLLANQGRGAELQQMIEEWLADIIEGWGFAHPLVRELARQRSGLALYGVEWARSAHRPPENPGGGDRTRHRA